MCEDGDGGAASAAHFDRTVATVGCADISPAWIEQLTADGQLLLPLAHGATHPRVRLRPNGQGASGSFMGRSGFVPMQGVQEHASPWPHPSSFAVSRAPHAAKPLPDDLRYVFISDRSMPPLSMAALDLGMYLPLRDRRAGFVAALVDGESMAGIEESRLLLRGEHAADLERDLITLAREWRTLGSPSVTFYETNFEPAPAGRPDLVGGGPAGPWQIRRLRFLQNVRLAPATR